MPKRTEESERCQLCGRLVPRHLITLHHLTPRERGGKAEDRVALCSPCHKQIHALFDNRHLEANFGDIDALRRDPALQRFIKWIRKQPATSNVQVKRARDRARRGRG
jgi:hypothetical protein